MISWLIVTYGDKKRWGWKEELWVFCWLVVGLLDVPIFFPLGALIGESICIQKSTAKQIGDVNPVIISDPNNG